MTNAPVSPASDAQHGAMAALVEPASRLWRWLTMDALPLWGGAGTDRVAGGFFEALDEHGTPSAAPRRARVTPRQIYAFAIAAAAGWDGPASAIADHGVKSLLERFRRSDGLYRTLVTADGRVVDDSAALYDQAFVLLGLHGAHTLLPDRNLRATAEDHLDRILRHFAHAEGGFRENGPAPFQSNAQMHLFEACLAWAPVAGGRFLKVADELARLCLDRFIDQDSGCIDEYFDAAWRPLIDRRIEPGHQYEWAWLLGQWSRLSGADVSSRVDRLFRIGEAAVIRPVNAAPGAISPKGALLEPTARLWPQTERLRTAAWLATTADTDRAFFVQAALDAAALLFRYLDTPLPGLWRDKLRTDVIPDETSQGIFIDEPAPASSLYHLATAITALKTLVLDAAPAGSGPEQ